MRWSRLLALTLVVSVPYASAPLDTAKADFNPEGRRPPRPGGRPGPRRPPATAKGPTTDALIARYMGIVMSRPGASFPLRRLSELYRERDGDLTKLIADLQGRVSAGGADKWAAKVALAGIFRIDKRHDEAIRMYRAVIQERPNDPEPIRALAEVMVDSGKHAEAKSLYDSVLSKVKARVDKEDILRALVRITLEQKDYAGAKGYHKKLVKLAQGSLFVRAELGRELMQRGEFQHAEAEYRELVKAAAGDNRALAPALRDLGQVLVRQRKNREAIEVLRRALSVAGQGAGVRREVHVLISEAYRAEGKLPELIELLQKRGGRDFDKLHTLGLLLEETGRVDKALGVYRQALRVNPRHIDTRLKVIHILQAQGELETAIKEYEALIRSVPNNPDFVFELCDILIQRGNRKKALTLLTRLEGRSRDEDQLGRVADFYERIEESDRAMRILQRLAGGGSRDPQYIIDLGDRYYQQGEKKKALDTWKRLRVVIRNRAEASASLGEVYLEHDMAKEALEALREAVKLAPKNLRYLKSLAMALERAGASKRSRLGGRYNEALQIWQRILTTAEDAKDKMQAREARLHIVTLWALSQQLNAQVAPLSKRFAGNPPDISAGMMLAEVQTRMQQLPRAEATLTRLIQLRPGNSDIFLALEKVYVKQRKLDSAIKLLKRMVKVEPKRARQYYQRMAKYAAELYRDDEAVSYAAQAVALAPDDADGHRKLGEMHRRRQDNKRAIAEFRAAIAKNDRLFIVYFDLAELLLAGGDSDEADQLYRRVVRMCHDEELVARAARLSMQLNLGKGTLEVLERELLPTSLGHPQKSVYRRLLVDLYGAMTFPLVQRVRYGTGKESKAARARLAKIGTRAVKPLLDALADENEAQQLIAIEVLAFVQNRSAAPALFAFATGHADSALRARAMVACGALRDPSLLGRYRTLLRPKGDAPAVLGGPIPVAAAWGVARMDSPKAAPLLRELAQTSNPELRALALLGLGVGKHKAAAKLIADVAASPDAGNLARAAAALALAEMGAKNQTDQLLVMARSPDSLPREAALLALSRLNPKQARAPIAEAIFETSPTLRRAAFASALVVTTKSFNRPQDPFAVPDGPLRVRAILASMIPSDYSPQERARALVAMEEPLTTAAVSAVRTSPSRASFVADALLSRASGPGLAPFTDDFEKLPPAERKKAETTAKNIAQAVVPGFIALVRHPSTDVRIRAIRVLGRQNTKPAQDAVIDALGDDSEEVQRAALAVLGDTGSATSVRAIASILTGSESWALRVRAASALGAAAAGQATREALSALKLAAQKDKYALVRQASLESLAKVAPAEARAVLQSVAKNDDEPRVRERARKLLGR